MVGHFVAAGAKYLSENNIDYDIQLSLSAKNNPAVNSYNSELSKTEILEQQLIESLLREDFKPIEEARTQRVFTLICAASCISSAAAFLLRVA